MFFAIIDLKELASSYKLMALTVSLQVYWIFYQGLLIHRGCVG